MLIKFLTMTNVPPEEWSFEIGETRSVIGRGEMANIQVPMGFQSICRCHAEIWADSQATFYCDLGSASGSQINGAWVKPNSAVEILDGDKIQIGQLELQIASKFQTTSESHDATSSGYNESRQSVQESALKTLLHSLTSSELRIVLMMTCGQIDDVELGDVLRRSPGNLHTQIANVFQKLGVHSRAELMSVLASNLRSSVLVSTSQQPS